MNFSQAEKPEIISKLNQDICVAMLTYSKHRNTIIKTLTKLNEIEIYKIVSYNQNDIPPNPDTFNLCEILVTTHPTMKNVNYPWIWHMRNCTAIMKQPEFKYGLFICGDTLIGRPERIFKLPDLLEDNDILSYAYSHRAIGTFCWFVKIDVLDNLIKLMDESWHFKQTGAVGVKLMSIVKDETTYKLKEYDEMDRRMFSLKRKNTVKSFLTKYLELEHLY